MSESVELSIKGPFAERLSRALALNYSESVLLSRHWWRLALKRMVDLAGSVFLALILAPVMGLIALAVRWDSRGPVLFVQKRVGRGGRIFRMFKFRTMVVDAERKTGPVWARAGYDPRVTRLGRFLRQSHLDELPQIFNVIRGEMSLVGPRPERPHFVGQLAHLVAGYEGRLVVKPGLTGLAQIHYRYDQTTADVRKKLRFDLLYIKRMCLMLDARILAGTVWFVATSRAVE